jgi:tetratricopeptide (TPR) repeat protein
MIHRFTSRYTNEIVVSLILSLMILVCYQQVSDYGFINYDDPLYVADNEHVQAGMTMEGLVWAFRDMKSSSNWHPLTWLSHMIDWQLFRANAGGHHWTNVVFHLVNTLLLFYVLRLMTGTLWRSACVAALFAVHPLNVESVAWVAERKNVLSTFLGLLTLLLYVFYIRKPGWKRYLPVLTAFALGLMAKPMLVTLPFLLILLDYWPGRRFPGKLVNGYSLPASGETAPHPNPPVSLSGLLLEKIPLILLSVLSIAATLLAAERGGALKSMDHFPLAVRLGNSLNAYTAYIRKFFWPQDLAVFYPHPGILPLWQTTGAALLIAAVTVFVLIRLKKCPYLSVGWFWFLGTLVPVIGLVQVGLQATADRYVYFPLIGLLIMLAWGGADLCKKWVKGRVLLILLMITFISTAALWTRQQLRHWQSSRTLFKHALAVTGGNPVAYSNLAHALFEEGNWKGAEANYRAAIRSDPKFANAYANLGAVLARQGRIDEAVGEYRKALAFNPRHADAHYHLGLAMENQARFSDADRHYEAAQREKTNHVDAIRQRGMLAMKAGNYEKAAAFFQTALRIHPGDPGLKAALLQAVERRDDPQKVLDRKVD